MKTLIVLENGQSIIYLATIMTSYLDNEVTRSLRYGSSEAFNTFLDLTQATNA